MATIQIDVVGRTFRWPDVDDQAVAVLLSLLVQDLGPAEEVEG